MGAELGRREVVKAARGASGVRRLPEGALEVGARAVFPNQWFASPCLRAAEVETGSSGGQCGGAGVPCEFWECASVGLLRLRPENNGLWPDLMMLRVVLSTKEKRTSAGCVEVASSRGGAKMGA